MPDFLDNTENQNNLSEDKSLLDLHEPHSIDIDAIPLHEEQLKIQNPKKNITQPPTNNNSFQEKTGESVSIPVQTTQQNTYKNNVLNSTPKTITQDSNFDTANITTPAIQPTSDNLTSSQIQDKQSKSKVWSIFKMISILLGIFIFIYLFLNFPAIVKRLSYYYQKSTGSKPAVQTIVPDTVNKNLLFLDTVTNYAPEKDNTKNVERNIPSKNDLGLSGLENDQLWVPKIDVKAPIVWDSPVDEATMLNNLKYGVVHYKGTTKPGEVADDGKGNVFISGHSSYYWWDDGKYKTVFANLDQLNEGDEIAIGYEDIAYVYKVVEKKEVDPNDVSVLAQNTEKPTLSLMTCVPVGTNLRRLIIKAELMARASDDPSKVQESSQNTTATETTATSSTPTSATVTPQPSLSPATTQKTLPWVQ